MVRATGTTIADGLPSGLPETPAHGCRTLCFGKTICRGGKRRNRPENKVFPAVERVSTERGGHSEGQHATNGITAIYGVTGFQIHMLRLVKRGQR